MKFVLLSSLSFLLTSPLLVSANTLSCIDNVDPNHDYFPHKVSPKFSQHWDISYHNTYKIYTNKVAKQSYLMYQCGSVPPASEAGKHDLTFAVPLQDGLVVTSTTQSPHMEQLGLRRQVKAFMGDPATVSSPCLQRLSEDEVMKTVHDDNSWNKLGVHIDDFLTDHPDMIVLKGSAGGANAVVVSESSEAESQDIYEWHKVYGALFNLEETANQQFDESVQRFDCASRNADIIAESRALAAKPTVLWARYSDWGGDKYWDVARCDEKNEYYCDFADKCHSTLLHSNSGSINNTWTPGDFHMTNEEFFEFGKDADYWIYTGNNWEGTTLPQFENELSKFKSVQDNAVYDTNKSGSGAWFEQRLAEYDLVLQDFCEVVGHNDDTVTPHVRKYFRKVLPTSEKEPIGDMGQCASAHVDLPWETRASTCVNYEKPTDDKEKEESSGASVGTFFATALTIGSIALSA